jgi:hypothetical protein
MQNIRGSDLPGESPNQFGVWFLLLRYAKLFWYLIEMCVCMKEMREEMREEMRDVTPRVLCM